jgi:hypothetical protein
MARKRDVARKTLSVGISVLMLTLSIAVPVLERADLVAEPVAESEHDPDACPPPHDHTICTQVSASFSLPAMTGHHGLAGVVVPVAPPPVAPSVASAAFSEGHRPRAPPLA